MQKCRVAGKNTRKLNTELVDWAAQVIIADIKMTDSRISVNRINHITSSLVSYFAPWDIQILKSVCLHNEVAPDSASIYTETATRHVYFNKILKAHEASHDLVHDFHLVDWVARVYFFDFSGNPFH